MAGLDADREREEAPRPASELRRRRASQSNGRPRDLSLLRRQGYAVPHPRHQPARMDRTCDLVGLCRRDDQRWTDRHDVAHQETNDQPFLFGVAHRPRANACPGVEGTFGLLVGDQFDATDKAETARLTNQRMLAERGEPGLEMRRLARGLLSDAFARIDV